MSLFVISSFKKWTGATMLAVGLGWAALHGADVPAPAGPAAGPQSTSTALAPPKITTATLTLLVTPKVPSSSVPTPTGKPAGLLDQWTVTSTGQTSEYWGIAWLGSCFGCVGNNGTLMTSPDGVVWTRRPTKTSTHLFGIATNGKIYVVAGDNGTLLTSPDLENWTKQPVLASERLFNVIWQGSQFVVLGTDGATLTSPDGLTWTNQPRHGSITFHHGIWTGSQFVMTAYEGLVTSPDAQIWSVVHRASIRMFDVATNGSLLVAVGTAPDSILTSADGVTWTPRNFPTTLGFDGVTWTGTQFVAAGGNDTLASSPDGATWTSSRTGTGLDLRNLAVHGKVIAIMTQTGELLVNQRLEKVAAPDISLAPGVPGSVPQIMLSCPTPGAKIYYSSDGSEPTANSTLYTGPFTFDHSCAILTRAIKDGAVPSELAAAQFIPGPPVP